MLGLLLHVVLAAAAPGFKRLEDLVHDFDELEEYATTTELAAAPVSRFASELDLIRHRCHRVEAYMGARV
jgi:hypothetical protein